MGKKIVILFPGIRGCEIPLLYFSAKHYEDMGYEKRFIDHSGCGEITYEAIYENAEKAIQSIDFAAYEHIVFAAKSIGTVVACRLKEKYRIPASLILFTPLKEALPYLHHENDIILAAAGDQDKYLGAEVLKEQCEKEGIKCHIESGVGHRMEIKGDLQRSLEILYHVISKIE